MAMLFKAAQYKAQTPFSYKYVEASKDHFKGWKLKFTKNNLKEASASLTVIGKQEGQQDIVAPCSKPLSDKLRAKIAKGELTTKEAMAFIWFKTWIITGTNQKGEPRTFIAFPEGQQGEELDSWGEEDLVVDEEKINAVAW